MAASSGSICDAALRPMGEGGKRTVLMLRCETGAIVHQAWDLLCSGDWSTMPHDADTTAICRYPTDRWQIWRLLGGLPWASASDPYVREKGAICPA
jgi:hypothetical protein